MTNTRASKCRRGTVLTIVGAFMLPAGFFIVAGWRDESWAEITIGAAVVVVSIAGGVVGLRLHRGAISEVGLHRCGSQKGSLPRWS